MWYIFSKKIKIISMTVFRSSLVLLKNRLFFRAALESQQNWEEATEISHIPLAAHTYMAYPIINVSH